jgi:hypothetical protein
LEPLRCGIGLATIALSEQPAMFLCQTFYPMRNYIQALRVENTARFWNENVLPPRTPPFDRSKQRLVSNVYDFNYFCRRILTTWNHVKFQILAIHLFSPALTNALAKSAQ